MKINRNILFLLFILFVSCTESKKEVLTEFLTNGSKKYWVRVMDNPIKRYKGVSFDIKGTYDEFVISDSGYRTKSPLWSYPVWKLINDHTISDGNGDTLKIEYINDEIVVFNNLSTKRKYRKIFVLLKADDQKTMPLADTASHPYKM